MGLNFQLPFLIIGNCAQLQRHHPLSFLLLFDDKVTFHCIISSLQVYLTMHWHFSRKSGCYHYGHSYPMQKSGTAAREGLGGLTLFGWLTKYFILFYLIHHIHYLQKQLKLHII